MGLKRTADEIAGGAFSGGESVFCPAEILQILYETKPEVIKNILPPPLEPYEKPYLILTNSFFRGTSFDEGLNGPGYKETGLYVPCRYKGQLGSYIAAMTLDSDIGAFLGRELSGLPKKLGAIGISHKDNRYVAYNARHGIPYVTMEAILDGTPNDESFLEEFKKATLFDDARPEDAISYSFKYTLGTGGRVFQSPPFLLKALTTKKSLRKTEIGSADIRYLWSDDDPWAEAEVVKILGCVYDVVDFRITTKEGGAYLVSAQELAPFAYNGWDYMPLDKR